MTPAIVPVINGQAYIANLQAMQRRFDALVMEALHRVTTLAATYAKTSNLFKSHTYRLRGSIKSQVIGGFGGVVGAGAGPMGRISANAPYALFVEEGTSPHFIFPRRKKVLRFVQNGTVRFARQVYHPGSHGRFFMADAAQRAEPLLHRLLSDAVVHAMT